MDGMPHQLTLVEKITKDNWFPPYDYMNTLIQNIKYKLISKISPFMTHPNQPVNQAQQFLHITGSEDLNAD